MALFALIFSSTAHSTKKNFNFIHHKIRKQRAVWGKKGKKSFLLFTQATDAESWWRLKNNWPKKQKTNSWKAAAKTREKKLFNYFLILHAIWCRKGARERRENRNFCAVTKKYFLLCSLIGILFCSRSATQKSKPFSVFQAYNYQVKDAVCILDKLKSAQLKKMGKRLCTL